MAKTKWRCREYKATGDMPGTHSFYAEAVINSEIDNNRQFDLQLLYKKY